MKELSELETIYQLMGHEICKSPFDELVMDAIGLLIQIEQKRAAKTE